MPTKPTNYCAIALLLALGISTRFLPHPANFTAIGAVALFGGLYLPKKWAVAGPLLAMVVSDLFLGFYTWQINLSVYAGFVIMGVIGLMVRRHKNIFTVIGGTLLGSIIYFLLTNAAVWAFGTLYPHTLTGLTSSYYMALPFFKNSLAGDLFYIAILAGGYELITNHARITKIATNN